MIQLNVIYSFYFSVTWSLLICCSRNIYYHQYIYF